MCISLHFYFCVFKLYIGTIFPSSLLTPASKGGGTGSEHFWVTVQAGLDGRRRLVFEAFPYRRASQEAGPLNSKIYRPLCNKYIN